MLQQTTRKEQLAFYVLIALIILLSYSFYSSSNYALLNSDDGMAVLMAHYFDLPGDFYCWGQDRLGSLIPLISQVFIKVFGASAITAVSLSNYLILILGYIGFSSLLKTRFSKIALALILFFPFQRFIDITRFTIGVEYCLIGFALFLALKVRFENKSYFNFRNHFLLAIVTLILGLSIWASDLAAVTIAVLLFVLYIRHYRKNRSLLIRPEVVFYLIAGIAFWTWFILLAKSYAVVKTEQFASLNGIGEILRGISIMFQSTVDVLLFKDGDYLTGIYVWLLLPFLCLMIVLILRKKIFFQPQDRYKLQFLSLDFLAVMAVILISHWVLINEMGRRYFVGNYITLSLIVLLLIENLHLIRKTKIAVQGFLLTILVVGALSPLYNMQFVTIKTLQPMSEKGNEFKQLGEIGIIADYWNAYVISCSNPDVVIATPHDKSDVRNPKLVEKVFAQPKLYVIRDMWMDKFPDTLNQFGYTLVKSGDEFFRGGCFVCRYKRLSLSQTFEMTQLKYDPSFVQEENGVKTVAVAKNQESAKGKHLVFGPGCSLLPGKYTVRYHLKAEQTERGKSFGLLDISSDFGQRSLLLKEITPEDLSGSGFVYVETELIVQERSDNVEFRFLYSGNAAVSIDRIELIER